MFWNPLGALSTLAKTGDVGAASNTMFGGWDVTGGYNIQNPLRSVSPAPAPTPTPTGITPLAPSNSEGGPIYSNQQTNGGYSTYTGGGSGAGAVTSYAAPVIDQAALQQYDQSIGVLNDGIGRVDTQLGVATGNIDRNYSTKLNELTSARASNEGNYKDSSVSNQQSYRTNKNAINDQTSAGLRGLMRQLGAYGAVGSDMQLASGAVNDDASAKRSGAGQTFGQNQRGLDTNWGNYLNEWANSKKKVDDWHGQERNGAIQQSLTQKQDLLSKLADLRGQRAAAAGGNYAGGAAGTLAEARGLSGRIDQLGAINPTYTGVTPTYTAPSLASYATPNQTVAQIAGTGTTSANPNLLNLLGLQDEERRLV